MSLPEPRLPLAGGCTVIFNNTLYSYSSEGLQSIVLEEGSEWEKLPGGHSVTGGVCVGSTPKDLSTAGLFIVGGVSEKDAYPGLQKFTYSTGEWKTIKPQVTVTKNRVYHSATYINSTESLLVYAGSMDKNPDLSQQTFTIGTSEPYGVLAFRSDITPPGVAPILLPWSETQAALIGGNAWNTHVMLFDTTAVAEGITGSWVDSGITLAEPLPKNTTELRATIIQADDGSKHLYTFDLTTLPNKVNRMVLIDADGAPVVLSAPVRPKIKAAKGEGNGKPAIARRDLRANNWPTYNSTFAPQDTRSGYAITTHPSGLVVMSGGNDDNELCMFNAKTNAWEDTTAIFGSRKQISIQSTPPTTAAPISTSASSSPSSTIGTALTSSPTAATSGSKSVLPPTTVLGIALGSIFGVALLLALILICLKRRQRRRSFVEAGHARRASGIPEKIPYPGDAAQTSSGYFKGHNQQESQGSFSSMAMFLGKSQKSAIQRKGSNEMNRASNDSTYGKDFKHAIGRPQPQMSSQPAFLAQTNNVVAPPESTQPKPRSRPPIDPDSTLRRSSGWNRYWSGGSASILGFGGNQASRRDTEVSDESSRYSDARRTQDSATVPPLKVNIEGRPSFHHVNSSSPTISQYDPKIREGLSGTIERPVSAVSAISSSGYSSGIPPSVHEAWDPTMPQKPWGSDRAPSSAYSSTGSESLYTSGLGAPAASRPSAGVGMSTQPQLAVASVSDMSWLNLGENDKPVGNNRFFN